MSDDEVRAEIADSMRTDIDELSRTCHEAFLEYLSLEVAEVSWREDGVRWCREQLLAAADALAGNVTDDIRYEFFVGTFIPKASEEYFSFFNFLESTSFISKQILLYIVKKYTSQPKFMRESLEIVETFFLQVIRQNLERFAKQEVVRGTLTRQIRPLFSDKRGNLVKADATEAEPDAAAAGVPAINTNALAQLTDREREVVGLVASGLANKEIAQELHISLATVKRHVSNALSKLGLGNRTELALLSIRGDS